MDLQTRVKEYITKNGIKKMHLAHLLGTYPYRISEWFAGKYSLNKSQIKTVEDFLEGKLR